MKTAKILVMIAMCGSSLTPAFVTPAFAITASGTTAATMSAQCSADLGSNAAVLLHDGSPSFSTQVIETGSIDGPPTEVSGTRVETPGSRFGTGDATYSNLSIAGDPYRTGGSVNLFGDQVATNKHWSNSEYDFTAQFATVTTFSYECHVTQRTEFYTPPVTIPGSKVQGYYVVRPSEHGSDDATEQACAARNNVGDSWPLWGTDTQQCLFVQTGPATPPSVTPGFWTINDPIDRGDLLTSHTVDETNFAQDNGHEANAGPWIEVGNWFVGKVVVCNSPGKLPGTWRAQNGYNGSKCNTTYFNSAPWGGGSQTSNGTYISVPGT